MKHHPSWRLLAIAAAAAFMFASCGGDDDDTSSGGSGGAVDTTSCGSVGAMSGTQPVTDAEKCAILKVHNDARAEVGVPALTWSDSVAASARAYAQKCIWGHSTYNGYSSGNGENLFATSGGSTVADAVNSWVKEKQDYHGEAIGQGNINAYGHYTQVVWKGTTQVGCGYAYCSSFTAGADTGYTISPGIIFVCQYSPPGNYTGQKPY